MRCSICSEWLIGDYAPGVTLHGAPICDHCRCANLDVIEAQRKTSETIKALKDREALAMTRAQVRETGKILRPIIAAWQRKEAE